MTLRADALRTGFAASLLLHLFALVALLALIRARPLPLPLETSIDVEFLQLSDVTTEPASSAAPTFEPQRSTPSPAEAQPLPLNQASASPDRPASATAPTTVPSHIHATEILSGKVLAEPRSREALRQLRLLAAPDQIEQLCNLEAMQQVHRWKPDFAPEFVVAYAASDPIRAAHSIEARGAAFLSHAHWYAIDFSCSVTDDLQAVASFEFQVGSQIPEDKWDEYSLFASSKAQD